MKMGGHNITWQLDEEGNQACEEKSKTNRETVTGIRDRYRTDFPYGVSPNLWTKIQ